MSRRNLDEQKYDKDRQEMYPSKIKEPYSIERKDGYFVLMLEENIIQVLRSESEHGAIREGNIFIRDALDL